MRQSMRSASIATFMLALLVAAVTPAAARQAAAPGLLSDLLADISQAEQKIVGLANAIPEGKWDWRPGDGVRSVREVFAHIAADNYYIPIAFGAAVPADTKIMAGDYESVKAYEERGPTKAQAIAELTRSFAHLKKVLTETKQGSMEGEVELFGMKKSLRAWWILTATHLHEHLGQAIAYARTNGVTPPWSM